MSLNKSSLAKRIKNELGGKGFKLETRGRDKKTWVSKFAEAVAAAVVAEIKLKSELSPISTDQGNAGAGIITGKVK